MVCTGKYAQPADMPFSVKHFSVHLCIFGINILILVALHKESSLHLPSNLLFCSLAITDLCVGTVSLNNLLMFLNGCL